MSVPSDEKTMEVVCRTSSATDLVCQRSDGSPNWEEVEIQKWKTEVVEEHFKEREEDSIDERFRSLLTERETLTEDISEDGGARGDDVLCDLLNGEGALSMEEKAQGYCGENFLKESEEDNEGRNDFWNQDFGDAGGGIKGAATTVSSREVLPPLEEEVSRLNDVGTGADVAAGSTEVVVKKEIEMVEESFRNLPPAPKWWKRGAPILCLDGWQSGDTAVKVKKGKNASSIILACNMRMWEALVGNGNNEGNAMWRRLWDRLCKMAADHLVVWKGHSSIGHTVRMDFVFPEEELAKQFLTVTGEMRKEVMKENVQWHSFSHTEEEMGWGDDPVLKEQDIVAITVESMKGRNFFSHFVTCQAVEDEKGRVICRFNNISDLNLLLFNKVKTPSRRVKGTFCSKGTRLMVPDPRKKFRLLSSDGDFLPVHGHLQHQYDFWVERRSLNGLPHFLLSFPTKLALMKFFTSREAKAISHLQIDESCVVDVVKREQEATRMREGLINSQAGIMMQLAKEIKEMKASAESLREKLWRPPAYVFLRLEEVLSMEFVGEGPDACNYPRLLTSVLASDVILGIEEVEDVGIVFRFKDAKSLHKELMKWMGKEMGKKGVATFRKAEKKQRAALLPDPVSVTQDFEVIVELQEVGLGEVSIMEVDNTLEQLSSEVSLHLTSLSARLPTIYSLVKTLQALRRIGQYHRVMHYLCCLSEQSCLLQVVVPGLCYYDCSRRFFNGQPCLAEETLLSLADLAGGLRKFLPSPYIIGVEEDWEGKVVALVDQHNVEKLFKKLKTSWAALSQMTSPATLCDNAGLFVINCRAPPFTVLDLREFQVHSADCTLVGLCIVASRRRAFVIRVFQDQNLRKTYPKMELAGENWSTS